MRSLVIAIAAVFTIDAASAGDEAFATLARMVHASHTKSLPEVTRIEICVLMPEDDAPEEPASGTETFPVRTANDVVKVHASKEIFAEDCQRIANDWRSLKFQPNGAFCHVPAYGLRFFLGDQLIFSVSICWECHNFYMPAIDPKTGQAKTVLYAFDDNAAAKKIWNDLLRILPHPRVQKPALR